MHQIDKLTAECRGCQRPIPAYYVGSEAQMVREIRKEHHTEAVKDALYAAHVKVLGENPVAEIVEWPSWSSDSRLVETVYKLCDALRAQIGGQDAP